jgi:hypothetical protein
LWIIIFFFGIKNRNTLSLIFNELQKYVNGSEAKNLKSEKRKIRYKLQDKTAPSFVIPKNEESQSIMNYEL